MMVDHASEKFLQDNLLSEDDWGGSLGFPDLNDLTSSDQSSPYDGFYLGEEAKYEEEYTNQIKNCEGGPILSYDSPSPLLSPQSNDCNLVDELLQDLLQAKKQQNVPDDVLLQQGCLEQRRLSTHTSSSSAYSSCSDSGTPSPAEHFSDHGSCSSGEFHDQTMLTIDLTSSGDSDINQGNSGSHILPQPQKQNFVLEQSRKSNRYRCTESLSNDLMKASELEKAVRQACEETNRLLKLHKQLSGKAEAEITSEKNRQHTSQGQQDILKNLCEETIGTSVHIPSTSTGQVQPQLSIRKPSKRKASTLQDAIDRLQSANKSVCLNTVGVTVTQPTPFSRSAIVSNPSRTKTAAKSVRLESKPNEPCLIVTSTQPPPPSQQQNINLGNVLLNGTQAYTLTPTVSSAGQPVQIYIKQEPPTVQSCNVVGNMCHQPTMQNMALGNQKVIVSNGHSSNFGLNAPGVSVAKPEQMLCNNGQTIVIQQPSQNPAPQPVLKSVNISDMKPGTQPMVLTQSDLSRLAAQGVIKFHTANKRDSCIVSVSDESKLQLKSDVKPVYAVPKNQPATFPTVCDALPADAVGVINGTSVFVSGLDNHPQRGELDIKALKRHQRMIKNRASACESRQRRKEYLKTLEDQVTEVAEENKILKEKNDFLSTRVHELEIENKNLKDLLGLRQSQQKKTACVLMLVLFVGVNFFQTGFLGTGMDPVQSDAQLFSNDALKPVPQQKESIHHTGRHLLSLEDDIKDNKTEPNSNERGLVIQEKQTYWMDDLVRQYKDKHLQNFLKLLSETTSNSVKRMLRRKLKEELGITIPLPVPRSRRIAYTPPSGRQRMTKMAQTSKSSSLKADSMSLKSSEVEKPEIPPSISKPCEQPSIDESGMNETEAIRVTEDITQWAKRYTVERQEKAQESAEKKKRVAKKLRNTKSPSSRYEDYDNTTELAVYSRPSDKYNNFLKAIKRKNDTLYVFTLNKDHILLPATEQNTSSKMKMALVMPAITSNRQTHVDYETMIEIECEVINTRMFELKRADVPDFLDVAPVKGTVKTLDTASNDTMSQTSKSGKASSTHRQSEYRIDETEKLDEEQDAVVAVVSDAMETELHRLPGG